MIRVLVADDHAVVRRGIMQILEDVSDVIVAAEAGTGREVLQLISQSEFDLVILDIAMPEGDGLQTLKRLQDSTPHVPVLVLSMYPEQQYAIRTLRAGASGYLTKESAPDELITAIGRVIGGGTYVTQSLAEEVLRGIASPSPCAQNPDAILSDREYQVLRLIGSGKTVTDIAGDLSLSPKTVSTYRSRILGKLNLSSTAEIMRFCFQHQLVD